MKHQQTITVLRTERLVWQGSRPVATQTRPQFDAVIELEIDIEKLGRMLGANAIGNKSRKSSLAGGIIKATVSTDVPQWIGEQS